MLFVILLIFIVLAVLLAWFLISQDKGEKEPVAALWLAAGFGVAGAFAASYLEGAFISAQNLQPGAARGELLGAAFMVGLIEEACKFLPLAVFLYHKRYFNERTDGIIYFALAGLGFGLPENILYTIQFGTKAGMMRLLLTPVFHAAITGMIGYFLIKGKLTGRSALAVAAPFAFAVGLHGLYDFGLLSGIAIFMMTAVIITMGLSAALFYLFMRATEVDQDNGISRVGVNNYCRSCGWANPKHHLYCVHCGKNA